MGAEFGLRILTEQLLGKYLQGAFQVCKGDILVHHQSLDLMEGRGMGGIHLIGTEHSAGGDHTDGQLTLLHDPRLYRGGLGSQHDVLVDIERILLILGRMVGRDVQLLKVVQVILHLGAFHHLIAHANEDPLYLFQGDGVGMTVSHVILLGRKGHVDDLIL